MGLILYIVSIILQIIFIPIGGILFGLGFSFYDTHIGNGFLKANYKFRKMAIGMDIFGNVACEELLNLTLIKKNARFKFGQFGETISLVLGLNLIDGTLTKTGMFIVKCLNMIEKDHCLKAVQNKEMKAVKSALSTQFNTTYSNT